MFQSLLYFRRACLAFAIAVIPVAAFSASIHGSISDPTGAVIPNATVELIEHNHSVTRVTADSRGQYVLQQAPAPGSRLRVSAPGFSSAEKILSAENNAHDLVLDIELSLASLSEQITVTSTGTPTPQAQLGVTVTVLNASEYQGTRDIQEGLRLIPGLQVTQTGQAGGTTSLFIRGGGNDANKLLIDGIPANDIGGGIEFANIASAAISGVEVLRGPNSALYGSDALAGVVSLTTTRGSSPLPLITYQADGGNFGTYHQEGTLGGAYRKLDYFSDYSRFDTSNSIPDDTFHNGTYSGNFGWSLSPNSSLRATVRHDRIASGQPNAIELYGIPSNAKQANEDAYFGVTWDDQTTHNWHNLARYGGIRLRSEYSEFSATGIPQYDDDGNLLDYLGAPITIHGANGYTVSGQALYQYVQSYPAAYPSSTDKDFAYAQSDYRFNPHIMGLFAFRYESERGYSSSPSSSIERGNYSYTFEVQGDIHSRLFYTLGGGLEDNGLYGFAGTPRASLAWQAAGANKNGILGGTKLRVSFGEGIKDPSVSDQTSSLYALLGSFAGGSELASQYHVSPIGPEHSRTYDGGVDQLLLNGRGRISLTLFHNEFTDGIEYIPQQGLTDLGVPNPVVTAAIYGATVNSQAYRAQGVEMEAEYQVSRDIFTRGGYTYVDATVQRSFSSDAIGPSFNPDFPTIPIGVDTPLIGARPFRIAPHTGYFQLGYRHSRLATNLRGTLVGSRDDSDFLSSDANGGLSLLLPNRNLDGAYQRLDLAASYEAKRYMTVESSMQNLLSEHYSEAFGYPALPFTFRLGLKFLFGGESWSMK